MATSLVGELKNVLGAGARANKYLVELAFPAAVTTETDSKDLDLLCKSASFPSKSVGQIEVFNQGRKFIVPGDTTFATTWNVTFYNIEAHTLRKDFINWMTAMDDFGTNTHTTTPSEFMIEMKVSQLDGAGKVTATYKFFNVFVQDIAEISVADETSNTIQDFSVTFSFTHWELVK